MNKEDRIKTMIDYIDNHICEPLTAAQLADAAGYSFHHFCHLFRNCTGVPVMTYIRRRRLELAANDIMSGKSSTQVALKLGFDTPSGFAKAFRKHYGLSPTDYKALTEKNDIGFPPQIRTLNGFSAVGYMLPPPKDEYDILDVSAYWRAKDFSMVSAEEYSHLMDPNLGEVGAWLSPDRTSGDFGYFFGPIVKDKNFIPAGLIDIDVPPAQYAVFGIDRAVTADELKKNTGIVWHRIFTDWLEDSPYILREDGICFEHYLGDDVHIFIPIREKE